MVDRNLTSEDVLETLAELFAMPGAPNHICSDSGSEFVAQAIGHWLDHLTSARRNFATIGSTTCCFWLIVESPN